MLCTLSLVVVSPIVALVAIALFARFVYPGYPKQRAPGQLKKEYGSWALVTGASAGLGTEFATQLASEGINIIVSARRKDRLETLVQELKTKYGIQGHAIAADLSAHDGPYSLHEQVKKLNLGADIGLIINNAGFGHFGKYEEQELKHIEEMIQLNVTSVAVLSRLFLADLLQRKQRGGMIITSSIGAYFPAPLSALYDATKVFDAYLSVGLHGEQKFIHNSKVDICSLEPGSTTTEFQQVAGSDSNLKRVKPDFVVNAGLNALLAGMPSLIPVHGDHFTTFASYLSRPFFLPIVYQGMKKFMAKKD